MNRKTGVVLVVGIISLLVSFGLGWRSFSAPFDSLFPSIICPVAAIVTFVLALCLLVPALRNVRNVQSTQSMKVVGTLVLVAGVSILLYAVLAFFMFNALPPNTADSRLPSLYLLFAGMGVTFLGTVLRGFQLHRK